MQVPLAGFDAGQLDQHLDEAVEPVSLLVYRFEHLAPPPFTQRLRLARAQVFEERRGRRLDGRERRAQVVRDGVEERGLQAFALLERLGAARSLERLAQLAVEPLDLALPGLGLLRPALDAERELSGGAGRDEERGQRDPVVRVVDGEGVDGREEEEVEAEHAERGGNECRPAPPQRRDEEHRQQQRQRGRRRVNLPAQRLEQQRRRSDAEHGRKVLGRPTLKSFPHVGHYSRQQAEDSRQSGHHAPLHCLPAPFLHPPT